MENKEDKERLAKLEREQEEKEKETIKQEEQKLRETTEKELMELKKKLNEMNETQKLASFGPKDNTSKELKEKADRIEQLEKELKEGKGTKIKREKSSASKSHSPDKKRTEEIDLEEEVIDTTKIGKRTVVKSGMDADEVMRLIKTVIESTQAGIPLETQTLGQTLPMAQTMPENFLKDLEQIQRDKINFVGTQGGNTIMNTTALSRRDKVHLVNLGLGKGLMDKDIDGTLKTPIICYFRIHCRRTKLRKRTF